MYFLSQIWLKKLGTYLFVEPDLAHKILGTYVLFEPDLAQQKNRNIYVFSARSGSKNTYVPKTEGRMQSAKKLWFCCIFADKWACHFSLDLGLH